MAPSLLQRCEPELHREGAASGSCCSLREDIAQLPRNLADDSCCPSSQDLSRRDEYYRRRSSTPLWRSPTTNIRQERSPGVLLVELPPAPNLELRGVFIIEYVLEKFLETPFHAGKELYLAAGSYL